MILVSWSLTEWSCRQPSRSNPQCPLSLSQTLRLSSSLTLFSVASCLVFSLLFFLPQFRAEADQFVKFLCSHPHHFHQCLPSWSSLSFHLELRTTFAWFIWVQSLWRQLSRSFCGNRDLGFLWVFIRNRGSKLWIIGSVLGWDSRHPVRRSASEISARGASPNLTFVHACKELSPSTIHTLY